ncbi:MAG: hypothetical protein IPM51_03455 [Sphingobacteriaceae bacterium]|nr:hypothetical protein [Sphingobacteriaceae bacterium]
MKKLIKIIFAFSFLALRGNAQIKELILENTGVQKYNGKLYVFGTQKNDKVSNLIIYKFSLNLELEDSLNLNLQNKSGDEYLQLISDTLHNKLNIYLYKKEKKTAQIIKIESSFKMPKLEDEIDVARINSLALLQKEIYYFNNDVYSIKTIKDTSGIQFYLNKHRLKKDKPNFEYEQAWQFPFEKKDINSALIIHADYSRVRLFVNIIDGNKKGQWLLNIHAKSGRLIKGTKISDNGGLSHFNFSKALSDSSNGKFYVFGQKYSEFDVDQNNNKLNLDGKKQIKLFAFCIDSLGEECGNFEFAFPILEPKGYANKIPINYIIRLAEIEQYTNGTINIIANIFKSVKQNWCYQHINTFKLELNQNNNVFTAKNQNIGTNLLFEKYYGQSEENDLSGKICIDTLIEFEKAFTSNLTFPIQIAYKLDEMRNPIWLLQKNDSKKNMLNISMISPVKKVYQITSLFNLSKTENPGVILINNSRFLIFRQSTQDKFLLQMNNW